LSEQEQEKFKKSLYDCNPDDDDGVIEAVLGWNVAELQMAVEEANDNVMAVKVIKLVLSLLKEKKSGPPVTGVTSLIQSTALDQATAKEYLQASVFPKLEVALDSLLETIEKNGEFEKYVVMLAEREDKEHRELRRRERERKRLEQGDNYVSDDDSLDENEEDEDDEDDSDYDSEAESAAQESDIMGGGIEPASAVTRKKRGTHSRLSEGSDIALRFNALRYLALNLKSQNDSMGVPDRAQEQNTPPGTSHKN